MSKFNYANEIYNINNQAPKALDMSAIEEIPEAMFGGLKAGQNLKKGFLSNDMLSSQVGVTKHENEIRNQYLDNPSVNRQYEPYLGIKSTTYQPTQMVAYRPHQSSFTPVSAPVATPTPVQPLNNTSVNTFASNPFQVTSSYPTDNTINGVGYISPNRTDVYHTSVLDVPVSQRINGFSQQGMQQPIMPQNNVSLEDMTINLSEPNRACNSLLMGDTGELTPSQAYARLLDDTPRNSGSSLWNLF